MGMSDNIAPRGGAPKVQMSAWQRWEMASVNHLEGNVARLSPVDPPALEPMPPALMIDEAELVRLRRAAHEAGDVEGREKGYARGHNEGYAAGLALAQEQAQSLRTLMMSLPMALRAAEREVADDLLALALDIARQVVPHQAESPEPDQILPLVRELLHLEPALNGTPRLLLHADDAALVQQHLADDLEAAGWRIRTDISITRGGCRVHAASGALDATLETRWERVAAALGRSAVVSEALQHE